MVCIFLIYYIINNDKKISFINKNKYILPHIFENYVNQNTKNFIDDHTKFVLYRFDVITSNIINEYCQNHLYKYCILYNNIYTNELNVLNCHRIFFTTDWKQAMKWCDDNII